MHVLAYLVAAVLYLAASIRYGVRFAARRRGTTAPAAALVGTGVLSHTEFLITSTAAPHAPSEVEHLSETLRRRVEKLLHGPTSRTGAAAENGCEHGILKAARSLFGIEEDGAGKHVAK